MEIISQSALHGGRHMVVRHDSEATQCPMEFALFIPGDAPRSCLYYLSGLTCTWENAATKSGAQIWAAQHGMVLVFPDTSPRGEGIADHEEMFLGKGAGYYMTATQPPWAPHYAMDSYIVDELPRLVAELVQVNPSCVGITGHSMGGHGALTLAMKNPEKYKSLSAFAPISALPRSSWGKTALESYLGDVPETFPLYDAAACMESHGWAGDILIDQGEADPFIKELRPDILVKAAESAGIDLQMRFHSEYDHSYWFVASLIADHINWHASRLEA